jgi:hypothetical protein
MAKALIGYTGFVGSNLVKQVDFEYLYNSQNVKAAYGKKFELVVYAAMPAEKFLANANPEKDKQNLEAAIRNLQNIQTKQLVLISTIDVYDQIKDIDEKAAIDVQKLKPYGAHRYQLERWVEENKNDYLIVRLPALFGAGLKKNYIYDLINLMPTMLDERRYKELKKQTTIKIDDYYERYNEKYWKVKKLTLIKARNLRIFFKQHTFNALSFTHPQSKYQFYNLEYLWGHIQVALKHKLRRICLNSEPVSAQEIYKYIFGKGINVQSEAAMIEYDVRSLYAELFAAKGDYIFDKETVLREIKTFVDKLSPNYEATAREEYR